jgi:hypothetical protein
MTAGKKDGEEEGVVQQTMQTVQAYCHTFSKNRSNFIQNLKVQQQMSPQIIHQ